MRYQKNRVKGRSMSKYIKGSARFTVISEGCVRIEYADGGEFLDAPTLFAVRESSHHADIIEDSDKLTLRTEKLTLTYTDNGPFSGENLCIEVHTGGVCATWHYGDALKNNLGGTLVTLDGVCGERPLPDGIISRDGFYVIDDSGKPFISDDGWIKNRSANHRTDLYFFAYGHDYKAAIRDLRASSGAFQLPRRCVFGSWYSRWWRYTADEFLDLVDQYDKNGFPLDIMVMDMDWHYQDWGHAEGEPYALYGYGHAGANLGWTGYTWNRTAIPDPPALLQKLKDRGIKAVLNDHPADGLRDHDDGYSEFIRELCEKGYTEEVPDIPEKVSQREKENAGRGVKNFRFNAGSPVYMDAFFNHALSRIESDGVEFWWLDWQQDYLYPTVNGIKDLPHLPWLNHLYYEHSKKGGKRGASFSRWGGIGDHKHPAYFSGDSVSGWETLAFEVKMTATAANAGCFWWSHDIGGFVDPIPGGQAENYVRWVQFGALSASLRLHMNGVEGFDRRPWTWGEPYCSAMREAFHLRSRLFPYIYSSAYESCRDSLPFIRPLYYECPEAKEAYEHPTTYFIGSHLIVSPVCEEMGESKKAQSSLWLPDGVWFDFFSGQRHEGGPVTVENDLFTFPLFVRAGAPIITQPYRDRMTTAAYSDLNIAIYADGENGGTSLLYEDDGETEDYKFGKCRTTSVTYSHSNGEYRISLIPQGFFEGAVEKRSVTVTLRNVPCLSLGSANAEISYCSDGRELIIKASEISASAPITFVLR
ncbi:MAG: DUF5110 domain-containing protein [Ruminococcaceae bacterium]|nr:DUF5110 domain-containing protein [Oscillospiraceae bacterium]